jgi:hypothetical protein
LRAGPSRPLCPLGSKTDISKPPTLHGNTEHDESQSGGIGKRAAMRSDLLLRSKWRGVSQESVESLDCR